MIKLKDVISKSKYIAIAGHVRPDGDCIGSCLGLYNYLITNYTDKKIKVFLEHIPETYDYIPNFRDAYEVSDGIIPDVVFALDSGDTARIGVIGELLDKAELSVCVDHHISNKGFGTYREIYPQASSTSEVIYELILSDDGEITPDIAKCLYTGIVQDTGLFKFDCTSPRTMEVVSHLMATGINFTWILDRIFYEKSYKRQLITALAINNSTFIDGIITSVVTYAEVTSIGATSDDLDGIVNNLLDTRGAGVCIFIYPKNNGIYKVSLRSKNNVNVSEIAVHYGGGGHIRAAGFDTQMDPHILSRQITDQIRIQSLKLQANLRLLNSSKGTDID